MIGLPGFCVVQSLWDGPLECIHTGLGITAILDHLVQCLFNPVEPLSRLSQEAIHLQHPATPFSPERLLFFFGGPCAGSTW